MSRRSPIPQTWSRAVEAGGLPSPGPARVLEVFTVALGLGLTSFGGPIAHLGYFERTYVERRRWLSADDFASLVALCQMVPGPASSQVGFLIGLRRAGWAGAFAAWAGFTLPSAVLMLAFAEITPSLTGPLWKAALHGLTLVAVAVVAQAVLSMGRKLCPDLERAALAAAAAALVLVVASPGVQLLALVLGASGGALVCRRVQPRTAVMLSPTPRAVGLGAGAVFLALMVALPLAARESRQSLLGLAAIFYRAGALVFGGGHVVLPLLRGALVPRWIDDAAFLAGYGAAQALPGPLFTFAAFLGAKIAPTGSGLAQAALWSATASAFIFLPGLLIATAGMAVWTWQGRHSKARGALAGVNAAVVGVLGAALYTPISMSAISGPRDFAIALIGFVLLVGGRAPPFIVVLFCIVAAIGLAPIR